MTTMRRGLVLCLVGCLAACGSGGGGGPPPTPAASVTLGVAYDPASGTATFRVWAPAVSQAAVVFYADWQATTPPGAAIAMAKDLTGGGAVDASGWNGVWQVTVPSVPDGQLYQYRLGGAAALDPYARSMGQFDSSTQAVGRGAVIDPASLKPLDLAHPGQVEEMVPFTAPDGYARREDAVVYEVHVRDFTIKLAAADLGGLDPGTYLAFTAKLDHIKALGATHIQLLPVLAYFNGDESQRGVAEWTPTTTASNYNWGYDPHNWFSPSGMYTSYSGPDAADPRRRVQELKTLVNEAHKRGLGVTLDVVYNHTANTGILDALLPGYFYRGTNSSGTGNDTASERTMMGRLIVDSVAYLTREYHLDGYRFDLMGLIDSRTMLDAYAAAAAVNPSVLFIGEGWIMPGVPSRDDQGYAIVAANQHWMTSTNSIAVFSDSYRDVIKGGGYGEGDDTNDAFLTLRTVSKPDLLSNLRGDPTNFTADQPADSVQYLTAHDGLTLHDKLAKILRYKDPGTSEHEIFKAARLGFVLAATSQGIAFVNGGCEFGRSKQVPSSPASVPSNATRANSPGLAYVYNSYDSSDAVNAFDWSLAASPEGASLTAYASGLYALRRSTDAFRLGTSMALAASNVTMLDGTLPNAIAYRAVDLAGATRYSVFVNAGTAPATMATGDDLRAAAVLVDSDEAGATPVVAPSGFSALTATTVTLDPRTAVIFRSPTP